MFLEIWLKMINKHEDFRKSAKNANDTGKKSAGVTILAKKTLMHGRAGNQIPNTEVVRSPLYY